MKGAGLPGPVPGVSDGAFVDDVDFGRLAIDQKLVRITNRGVIGAVGDVLPSEWKVFRGAGVPVRPFVARPEFEGELATP